MHIDAGIAYATVNDLYCCGEAKARIDLHNLELTCRFLLTCIVMTNIIETKLD